MKNFLLRTLPLFCLSAPTLAFSAETSSPYQAVIRAELTAKISETYTGGSLYMDGRKNLLDLSLQPKMPPCAEGFVCAQVMPEPINYQLTNTKTEIDHCGIIRTRALVDSRPSDGIYLSVIVNNNRNNTCPTLMALSALDVIVEKKYYDRIRGQEVTQRDTFEAEDFAMINPGNKDEPFTGKVMSARYKDKKLDLKLQYAGGCEDHAFDLKWGACKDVKVLNSVISECDVTVLHTAGAGDMCEALITKTHTIDLSGLAQAYVIKLNGTRVLIH